MHLVTHDQNFHYDEVLASAVLLILYPNASITRTRKAEHIRTGDIVYDVGRVYDPHTNRYDHHQSTFNDTFSDKYAIRMSSSGLIYKHFHKRLFEKYNFTSDSPIFDFIVDMVYREFFLPADACDNGYDCIFGEIRVRSVCDVVRHFNVHGERSSEDENARFMNALAFVKQDLENYLMHVLTDYVGVFNNLYDEIRDFQGDIFYTDERVIVDVISDLNELFNKDIRLYIAKGRENEFRIHTIPIKKGMFGIKYPLHKDWRGLDGAELDAVSGIDGCIFVHSTGFVGGNRTLQGALEMARRSLDALKCE